MSPAPVLAVLVGGLHTALFVFLRGRAGRRTAVILVAAVLGAWAGDAIGGRLDVDPLRIGDFRLISASIVAWAGIAFATITLVLGPEGRERS